MEKEYEKINTILKQSNNNDVIALSLRCLCFIPKTVLKDIKFFVHTYSQSVSLSIRNELYNYLSSIIERDPEQLKNVEATLNKTLPPDSVARLNLSNKTKQCICSIQWYQKHKDALSKLNITCKMKIVSTIFPLFTLQNKSFYDMMVSIINALKLNNQELKKQLHHQKSDVINHLFDSFPSVFSPEDLPQHYSPRLSPLHSGQSSNHFSFDTIPSTPRAESSTKSNVIVKTEKVNAYF